MTTPDKASSEVGIPTTLRATGTRSCIHEGSVGSKRIIGEEHLVRLGHAATSFDRSCTPLKCYNIGSGYAGASDECMDKGGTQRRRRALVKGSLTLMRDIV